VESIRFVSKELSASIFRADVEDNFYSNQLEELQF
jgi:hypothetical protein